MSSDKSSVAVPSPRPVAMREIQLIDRREEMQVLREAADRAIRGEGGVIFLHGEAGIGKTRLARELGAYARSQGMQVLVGRCPALFRMDGVPPYVLWEEVIKDYLEICTPEQLFRVIGSFPIEVSKLVPELKQKLRTFPQSFPLSPEHSRDRLFEAVSQFITNISKESPLLVILDDLQWTDQSSLLLLHYLARGVNKDSLLLLGAYRHTYIEKGHPLSPVLTELNRERLLQSVSLKRLSYDDVSEMIKRTLGQDEVHETFRKLIYEKTRGNPFFVEEVIKSLKEEEVIYREKNEWRFKEVSGIKFPETVKDVIKARISRLDTECQHMLTLASVAGKDFTFETLLGVTGFEEDKLLELMEKILKTGLIVEKVIRGEGLYSFTDIIVRDIVYDEISFLRRKKLHGTVGHALEKIYTKDNNEHLGELASHFLKSRDSEKALDYFLKAGEKATKVYANAEAASYLKSAYTLLEKKDGELREKAQVLEQLGNIKRLIGEHDDCMKFWNKALLLREQLHEKRKEADLHRKMANVLWEKGQSKKAETHYNKALEILATEPESIELASIFEDMAHMYYRIGEMTKALSQAEKALELAKKLKAPEVISSSYASLGTIFGFMGKVKKGNECHEKALKLALDNDYFETSLRVYTNLGASLPYEENEKCWEYLQSGYELAKKVGHISFQAWTGDLLADMWVGKGDMDKALLLMEEAVALDKKTNSLTHLSISLGSLGLIHLIQGEWGNAESYFIEALSISQRLNDFQSIAQSYGFLGFLQFEKGNYSEAKELLERVHRGILKAGVKSKSLGYLPFLIAAYMELGEITKSMQHINSLYKFGLNTGDKGSLVTADILKARLFRAQRRWGESIELFEKSFQTLRAIGADRWDIYIFGRHLFQFARVYLERGQEGDNEKAYDLLNQALEISQRLRAKKDIEKIELKIINLKGGRETVAAPEPEALPSHISTGSKGLDDLLLGGLPRNYAVILTAPSCDEKDLLVRKFLEAGVKEAETTFYITAKTSGLESTVDRTQSNFYLFACNPQADKLIKDTSNVLKLKGTENLNDINIALTSTMHRLDKPQRRPRRICIEIVSDVLLQHQVVKTRRWLNALIPELKSNGFTTLATIDSDIHPQREVRAVVGVFEGEINIYEKKSDKDPQKFLKIKKMTNQKYQDKELPLKEKD